MKRKIHEDCTLDISSPNDKLVKLDKRTGNKVVETWFYPKKIVKVTRVRDDKGLICETKGPVISAKLFHKDAKPYLLAVHVKKGESKYFIKPEDKWTEIKATEYRKEQTYLIVLGRPDKHCTIDINKPEDANQYKTDYVPYRGTKQVMFFPQLGLFARAVVDGEQTIWKAENDAQICPNANISYNQNQKQLLEVWISDMDDTVSKYYQLVNGSWQETDYYSFFKHDSPSSQRIGVVKKIFNSHSNPDSTCQ